MQGCGQSAGKSCRSPNLAEALTPQRLHAELLATSASGAWSYLFGEAHDATISPRHKTVRFGQADVEWLDVLRLLLKERGQKAWMYREGSTRQFWVLETSAEVAGGSARVLHVRGTSCICTRLLRRGGWHSTGMPLRGSTSSSCRRTEQISPTCGRSSKMRGLPVGSCTSPSRDADHPVWRFYVAAASHRDFVSRVGSWHPRKRGLLVARSGRLQQPG